MPKKIDPKVKERRARQVLEHWPEHASLTAAAESVARREGWGRRPCAVGGPGAVDGGERQGATTEEAG